VAVSLNKSEVEVEKNMVNRLLLEYDVLIEELRTRLNVLSTSLFLLHESSTDHDPKMKRYLDNINREMEKIRQLISKYPKSPK
jgi:signal transduction histidine kinase